MADNEVPFVGVAVTWSEVVRSLGRATLPPCSGERIVCLSMGEPGEEEKRGRLKQLCVAEGHGYNTEKP